MQAPLSTPWHARSKQHLLMPFYFFLLVTCKKNCQETRVGSTVEPEMRHLMPFKPAQQRRPNSENQEHRLWRHRSCSADRTLRAPATAKKKHILVAYFGDVCEEHGQPQHLLLQLCSSFHLHSYSHFHPQVPTRGWFGEGTWSPVIAAGSFGNPGKRDHTANSPLAKPSPPLHQNCPAFGWPASKRTTSSLF